MREFGIFFACSLALTSCSVRSYSAYVKTGTKVDVVNYDINSCNAEANKLFPVAIFTQSHLSGGYRNASSYNDRNYPEYWGLGTGISVTDVNSAMREEHRKRCMNRLGYTLYSFQICTKEQTAGRSFTPLVRSQNPSPNICALKQDGDSSALIDLTNPL